MVKSLATHRLGKSGIEISVIGTGLWAVGGGWGPVDDQNALRWILIAEINRLTSALLLLGCFLVPTGNH
jgi:hypothetical protein